MEVKEIIQKLDSLITQLKTNEAIQKMERYDINKLNDRSQRLAKLVGNEMKRRNQR